MLITTIPAKKIIKASIFLVLILLNFNSKYPGTKLIKAHITFVNGEDSPFPGGLEKGDGKGIPDIPFTKWGTKFAKNIAARNTII
ncbi:MAG: hypothetical protein WC358_10400 [Ignavibacteria bacterium]|jgi:hypothetical protein